MAKVVAAGRATNAASGAAGVRRVGIGIDTSRFGHQVAFWRDDKLPAAPTLTVMESRDGYDRLAQQLRRLREKYPQAELFVRIDAAGQYATNLERFLREFSAEVPLSISVGEPKRNKDDHHATSPKRQTDGTESLAMARYAVVEAPPPTPERPREFAVLRRVASRFQVQSKETTRLVNRLHEVLSEAFPELATLVSDLAVGWVLRLLQKYPTARAIAAAKLAALDKIPRLSADMRDQVREAARRSVGSLHGPVADELIRKLVRQLQDSLAEEGAWKQLLEQAYDDLPPGPHRQVETIPGIGKLTAAAIAATAVDVDRFATDNKLVGYYGVFPEERSSGVDKFGKPLPSGTKFMCAKGNDLVRGLLWNCAKSAAQCNPAVRSLYRRLIANGTRGDVALGYCMTKLLRLVYAVWKTDKPFDKNHYPWEPATPTQTTSDQTMSDTTMSDTTTSAELSHEAPSLASPQSDVRIASDLRIANPILTATRPGQAPPRRRGARDATGLKGQCPVR